MEPPEWPTEPPTAPPGGWPPAPPPPAGSWAPAPPRPAPNPWGVAALAFLIGSAVAMLIGGLTSILVFVVGSDQCSSSGELFCGLGWLVLAFLGGLAAAALAYVFAGVLFINQRMPAGQRAGPITTFLLAPIALTMVLGIIGSIAESLG